MCLAPAQREIMTTVLRNFWQILTGQQRPLSPPPQPRRRPDPAAVGPDFDISPDDPLLAYFHSTPGIVDVTRLKLNSPALVTLQEAGVKLAVPLISQGELIGLLNLGPSRHEQEYSLDDYRLLAELAEEAAPVMRLAQLVRQQQTEVLSRQRLDQELRVARLIQQSLLPKQVPQLPGWRIATYYQPARAVGGDFYDFVQLPEGRVGLLIGDVTDKGVPAAMVMATTRTLLRAVAQRLLSPGAVLERVNELLHPDIPANMFVTCLYAILDPATGRLLFANAGHDLPYRRGQEGVLELRATGMPLGLMPGMVYEEKEIILAAGESIVFYSDGLVEAHNPQREMFGFSRLRDLVAGYTGDPMGMIQFLLAELATFSGVDWEQEDDVTLVTLAHLPLEAPGPAAQPDQDSGAGARPAGEPDWQLVTEFSLPSELGNEREAMKRVSQAVQPYQLTSSQMERLKTAVAEAAMNAIEHGNGYRAELPVHIQVLATAKALLIRIVDQGGGRPIPEPEQPDLQAKLAGLQTPRGWGLFLIRKLMDEVNMTSDDVHHTIELILYLEGGEHAPPTA